MNVTEFMPWQPKMQISYQLPICWSQLCPPSAVCRITFWSTPTIQPDMRRDGTSPQFSVAGLPVTLALGAFAAGDSPSRTAASTPLLAASAASSPEVKFLTAAKATESRSTLVPLLCGSQSPPPSAVCRMTPLAPTAQPDCGVAKATESRSTLVPLPCGSQW